MLKAVNAYGEVRLVPRGQPDKETAVFRTLPDELYPDLLIAGMHSWEGMRPAFRGIASTENAPCVAVYDLEMAFELFSEVTVQSHDEPAVDAVALRDLFLRNVVGTQLGATTPLFCFHDA